MLKRILGAPLVQISLMTGLVMGGMLLPVGLFEHLENKNYDFWSARFRPPDYSAVSIVAIDEKSIRRLGDWPWPRSRMAAMVALLSSAQAEVLGICQLYSQPAVNPGVDEIRKVRSRISDPLWLGQKQNTSRLLDILRQVEKRLDQDAHLITAVHRAGKSVLPIRFVQENSLDSRADDPSGLLSSNSIKAPAPITDTPRSFWVELQERQSRPISATGIQKPFGSLMGKAGALGHINLKTDPDGVVRRIPLLVDFHSRLYPSISLQLALKQINRRLTKLAVDMDLFGKPRISEQYLEVSTDAAYHMLVNHDPQWILERTYSFAEVLNGTIDPDLFKNQVVLIGVTDQGAVPVYRVGKYSGVTMVEITANALARILSSKGRLSRPSWALPLEIVAVLYFALFLIVFIPRINIRLGAALLIIFMTTWYAIGVGLLLGYGYWIKTIGPTLLACVGFVSVQLINFPRMRRQEKLESNKTLGLTYQGQGMFDMAYEKYMLCPVEDQSVKHLLYNLGLDFERKRMFNKAAAIYRHLRTDGTFRDIKERITRLKFIEDPLSITGSNSVGEATLKADDTTKPTFGRYEILSELGHGAMGTVYLGRDPKINREVAIKTLEYAEIEPDEIDEVKERFFKEAEAAGKLSHPNIVSIFDAGEEHDIAYIAMELLTGGDLTRHCRKGNLLPTSRVINIISEVNAALAYAHKQGVVHRDIKPGNIMLLDDGRVKVTDFGIARVIDASHTRTGVVLGTPSYMSPEQVVGKNVDGRSDLFTLGIVFYQLLAGIKPFRGDNITAIMYAITHHAHVPLTENASDIPACIEAVVNKMLSKGVTKRYQSALQLSKALDGCMETTDGQ